MSAGNSDDGTRQSLDTLQLNVVEKDSLTTLAKKSIIDYFHPSFQKKKISCKATQVNLNAYLPQDELCDEMPSEHYWKMIAEKRRTALSDALMENESLHDQVAMLTKENEKCKQLLEEANSFIEVCKELMQDNTDDTGIDVRDMSTFNGTHEDDESN